MPAIRLLDRSVAELIAAGEVVERPASIIKELVENSLDAGATRLQVEIKNGGVRFIRVTDNGCGIPLDEMPTAFLRHATSKITAADDLDAIMTLGFRGEALASVAAMCRVELLSRQHDSEMGGRCVIEGGQMLLHEPAGGPVGTTIVVRDIFYNTPARMKFLKKDVTEAAAVSQIMERLALANTSVSFSYIKEGKRVFTTPGDGLLLSSVRTIFGGEFADGLVPVSYSTDGITISGLVSSPKSARATRSMQHFYINGRYIRSKLLSGAVEEACKHMLMGARFPGCVLEVSLRPGDVDVNIHPAKIEVRFSSERNVYNAVYCACREALLPNEQPTVPKSTMSVFALRDFDYSKEQQKLSGSVARGFIPTGQSYFKGKAGEPRPQPKASAPSYKAPHYKYSSPPAKEPLHKPLPIREPALVVEAPPVVQPLATVDAPPATSEAPQPEPPHIKAIGELFGTYILAEQGDEFYLVDKHATHERYLYDRLMANPAGLERQTLLSPITVQLSKPEHAAIIENLGTLMQMGVKAEDFGEGMLLVREVPMLLADSDIQDVVARAAQAIMSHRRDITPDYIAGLFASVACRGAIMAGDKSQQSEWEFIADLALNKGVTNCPHGRPTVRKYTRREIERMFGRLT